MPWVFSHIIQSPIGVEAAWMDRSRKVAKLLSRVATKRTCRKNVKRFSKTIVEMKYLHYMERFDRFKVWTRRLKLRDIQLVLLLPLSLPSLRPFPPLDPLRSIGDWLQIGRMGKRLSSSMRVLAQPDRQTYSGAL